MRRQRLELARPLRIGFLVLAAVSTAQLAWWMVDQVSYTAEVRRRAHAEHARDIAAARALLGAGNSRDEVRALYPHLTLGGDSAPVMVDPRVLAALDRERFHRLNRYAWEGAFFLAVLVGGMAVVAKALREEAALRRRQQSFLAAVSHELKSPLASLQLSADTLALRDPPPERRTQLVQRLLTDLDRLERMISNVLDASRLEEGAVPLIAERLALARQVAAAMEELRARAEDAGVELRTQVPADLEMEADPEAVRTVLRNLLENAIKAAAGGGVVTLSAAARDGFVHLEVEDQGVGFAPEEAPRLFEKFYRALDELRRRPAGTGLGLYIVRRYVTLGGGSVSARSEGPGRGAVFTVSWPAPRRERT